MKLRTHDLEIRLLWKEPYSSTERFKCNICWAVASNGCRRLHLLKYFPSMNPFREPLANTSVSGIMAEPPDSRIVIFGRFLWLDLQSHISNYQMICDCSVRFSTLCCNFLRSCHYLYELDNDCEEGRDSSGESEDECDWVVTTLSRIGVTFSFIILIVPAEVVHNVTDVHKHQPGPLVGPSVGLLELELGILELAWCLPASSQSSYTMDGQMTYLTDLCTYWRDQHDSFTRSRQQYHITQDGRCAQTFIVGLLGRGYVILQAATVLAPWMTKWLEMCILCAIVCILTSFRY